MRQKSGPQESTGQNHPGKGVISMRILSAFALSAVCACAHPQSDAEKGTEATIAVAQQSIKHCARQFRMKSGREISPNVDRVHVIVAPEQTEMGFNRGETGDFGLRSCNLEAYASCGVARTSPPRLIYLYDLEGGRFLPLIDHDEHTDSILDTPHTEPVWHLLFIRTDAGFEFRQIKRFDPVEYENKEPLPQPCAR